MKVFFNHKRQYFDVVLDDVTPQTFHRRGGGRWGYWQAASERSNRKGLFGEMHIVLTRVRSDVVAHELTHVLIDWLDGRAITLKNEERIASIMDEMTRNFWKAYEIEHG